jgi:uncharacterized membrane protein YgcG
MRSRRAAAVAAASVVTALSAAFVVGAPPAQAQPPAVSITSPNAASPLSSPVIPIRGEARMPNGGTVTGELRIDVQSLDGRGTNGITLNVNANPVPFSWDYATAYNGRYRIIVKARGRDGAIDTNPNEEGVAQLDVTVEAKPAPPADVKAVANAKREVAVTWKANTEADLLGYQVQRIHEDDDEWASAGTTKTTSFTDTSTTAKGGEYRYRVVAIRAGALAGEGIASDPSSAKAVQVADPPATTTTIAGSGGGSSGGSGGNSGSTGGGGGGSAGGGGGSAGGDNAELASAGKVDLSGFANLLDGATTQTPRGGGTIVRQAGEEDDGFGESLPFKPGEDEELGEDGTALAIGVEEAGEDAGRKPIAFVAASLLVTVILMHVLWLKREVEKAPLEAIAEPAP